MATQLRIKRGKTSSKDLSFMSDYSNDEIRFSKRRQSGRVSLEVWGYRPRPEGEMVERECEYGHKHMVQSEIKRDVVHVEFDEADIKNLREFFADSNWCKL